MTLYKSSFLPIIIFSLLFMIGCRLQHNEVNLMEDWDDPSPETDLFQNFQALQKNSNTVLLEGEMIRFTVTNIKSKSHKRTFRRIKKEYAHQGQLIAENDSSFPLPNRIWLKKVMINDTLFQYHMVYALASEENNIKVIYSSYYEEDKLLRIDPIVRYLVENNIPAEIFTDISAANVDFVGRDLNLEPFCQWESVHRLKCEGKGKIRWSLHQSMEDAEAAKKIHLAFSKSYEYSELVDEQTVPVLFEGEEVLAQRLIFRLKSGNPLQMKSDDMIVYYLTSEVRGEYIHAVLSHYASEAAPGGLPSLLEEVMQLQ